MWLSRRSRAVSLDMTSLPKHVSNSWQAHVRKIRSASVESARRTDRRMWRKSRLLYTLSPGYVPISVFNSAKSSETLSVDARSEPPNTEKSIVPIKQCCGSGSGIRCLLTPGSGMGKNSGYGSGSRVNNPDHISESLENIFCG
jgi:hypothetical protein